MGWLPARKGKQGQRMKRIYNPIKNTLAHAACHISRKPAAIILCPQAAAARVFLFLVQIKVKLRYTFGVCPDCGKRFFIGNHDGHIPF
jgi:hypothetical protein